MPPTWAEKPVKAPAAVGVILGYLEAFDPDVVVKLSKDVPESVAAGGRKVVDASEIWQVLETPRPLAPKFGIGVFEVLHAIFDKHFRYKTKYPMRVVVPRLPRKLSLFWASVFGEFPPKLIQMINGLFREPLEVEETTFEPGNFTELMADNVLFPRRIAQYGIKRARRRGFGRDAQIFFMDASRIEDIVDFWNLRALGHDVIALPKQLQADPTLKGFVVDFLKDHRRPWPHNPQVYDCASFVRSRNSTMEDMQKLAQTLDFGEAMDAARSNPFLSLQHWYPRIWDAWAREKDGAVPDDMYADETESEISETTGSDLRVKLALPRFAEEFGYHDEPRCANDVSVRMYGSQDHLAEVFPKPAGERVMRMVGGQVSHRGDWRIDRSGLVALVRHNSSAWLPIPLAEDVMFAWLSDLGWKHELSPPGLLAKQIYKQLEGNLAALRNETLLGLLEHMNGGTVQRNLCHVDDNVIRTELERDLSIGEVKERLSSGGANYDYLVSKGVFRLGISVQCPRCRRRSWFPLQGLKEDLSCPLCLRNIPAIENLTRGRWTYKTAGPFSVPAYAEGAYAVLLSVGFFDEHKMTTLRTTPVLSFKAHAPQKGALEADFAMLWKESVYGEEKDGALFGECKTYREFEKKDFERMRYLARTFPGAVLVFSTLRKSLTARETSEIGRIAKAGRRHWKADRPINPVLILTGTELLDWQGPPYCWDEGLQKRFQHLAGLLAVCNATQQIYLGMPSWETAWHEAWENKRKRKVAKMARERKP